MVKKPDKGTREFHSQLIQAAMGTRTGVELPVPARLYSISPSIGQPVGKPKTSERDYKVPMATRYFGEASRGGEESKGLRFPRGWPYDNQPEED